MKLGKEILWLSESDVASLFSMREALGTVESAFKAFGENQAQMPSKVYLEFHPFGGDLRTMPAYIMGDHPRAAVKIVNSNPNNPRKDLPAVSGVVVVVDPETGLVQALMAAGTLTALRTGAGGGIAAKYLARKDSSVVGLAGCGRQSWTQLEALSLIFSLKKVLVWGNNAGEAERFCQKAKSAFSLDFVPVSEIKDVCDCDILVTTTPVQKPIVKGDWIKPGTHINAIGADAPKKQELEFSILKKAKIFVDEWGQASHGGEINNALRAGEIKKDDMAAELGDVVCGKKPGRAGSQDITVFDSTGLAIQDVSSAQFVVEKAKKLNKGQVLNFHG